LISKSLLRQEVREIFSLSWNPQLVPKLMARIAWPFPLPPSGGRWLNVRLNVSGPVEVEGLGDAARFLPLFMS